MDPPVITVGVSFKAADAAAARCRLYGALSCRARAHAVLADAALSVREVASFTPRRVLFWICES